MFRYTWQIVKLNFLENYISNKEILLPIFLLFFIRNRLVRALLVRFIRPHPVITCNATFQGDPPLSSSSFIRVARMFPDIWYLISKTWHCLNPFSGCFTTNLRLRMRMQQTRSRSRGSCHFLVTGIRVSNHILNAYAGFCTFPHVSEINVSLVSVATRSRTLDLNYYSQEGEYLRRDSRGTRPLSKCR